jgi:hypothetical protein
MIIAGGNRFSSRGVSSAINTGFPLRFRCLGFGRFLLGVEKY